MFPYLPFQDLHHSLHQHLLHDLHPFHDGLPFHGLLLPCHDLLPFVYFPFLIFSYSSLLPIFSFPALKPSSLLLIFSSLPLPSSSFILPFPSLPSSFVHPLPFLFTFY